jgi:hypothetical protein
LDYGWHDEDAASYEAETSDFEKTPTWVTSMESEGEDEEDATSSKLSRVKVFLLV